MVQARQIPRDVSFIINGDAFPRSLKNGFASRKGPFMKDIVNLLFEARMLKHTPRTGYRFLGVGRASVAEHSFLTAFIGMMMASMTPEVDALRLISMCLIHYLAEARTGDLNYVQKKYVSADATRALEDALSDVWFGKQLAELIQEFDADASLEASLARDADQLALILELKCLTDSGFEPPNQWIQNAAGRIQTTTGKDLFENIQHADPADWWRKNYIDNPPKNK
jgi:putative hydrolase of HD superfamily